MRLAVAWNFFDNVARPFWLRLSGDFQNGAKIKIFVSKIEANKINGSAKSLPIRRAKSRSRFRAKQQGIGVEGRGVVFHDHAPRLVGCVALLGGLTAFIISRLNK